MRPDRRLRFYPWSLRAQWQPDTFGPDHRCHDENRRSHFQTKATALPFTHPAGQAFPTGRDWLRCNPN
jgi:hypothetical protein